MTQEEFGVYFSNNVDTMLQLGAAHPNSERGKFILAVLNLMEPRIKLLESKIEALETRKRKKNG